MNKNRMDCSHQFGFGFRAQAYSSANAKASQYDKSESA